MYDWQPTFRRTEWHYKYLPYIQTLCHRRQSSHWWYSSIGQQTVYPSFHFKYFKNTQRWEVISTSVGYKHTQDVVWTQYSVHGRTDQPRVEIVYWRPRTKSYSRAHQHRCLSRWVWRKSFHPLCHQRHYWEVEIEEMPERTLFSVPKRPWQDLDFDGIKTIWTTSSQKTPLRLWFWPSNLSVLWRSYHNLL